MIVYQNNSVENDSIVLNQQFSKKKPYQEFPIRLYLMCLDINTPKDFVRNQKSNFQFFYFQAWHPYCSNIG